MGARGDRFSRADEEWMKRALELAARGYGGTSPNPMVGAILVRDGRIIGEGWHERAGEPHAEVNAIAAASRAGRDAKGATLYVTLEPCCTFGRTPPCTEAILQNGIREVVAAATDPNPRHGREGFSVLRKANVEVRTGLLAAEANRLNEAFNFWITQRRPWVICKCAMSLDGKIATNAGESQWITSEKARRFGMRLRLGADAILVGINTVLRDDPALTLRKVPGMKIPSSRRLRRFVLDPEGRIPSGARVLTDEQAETTVVVGETARSARVTAIGKRARVLVAPIHSRTGGIDLRWLMKRLGGEGVTSLLVEGGGETHARFVQSGVVNRFYFFYAPLIIGGRAAPKGVAGARTLRRGKGIKLTSVEWSRIGPDLLCTGILSK